MIQLGFEPGNRGMKSHKKATITTRLRSTYTQGASPSCLMLRNGRDIITHTKLPWKMTVPRDVSTLKVCNSRHTHPHREIHHSRRVGLTVKFGIFFDTPLVVIVTTPKGKFDIQGWYSRHTALQRDQYHSSATSRVGLLKCLAHQCPIEFMDQPLI